MWKRMLLLASILAIGVMSGCAARATYYSYGPGAPGPRVRVYGLAPSRGHVWVEEYRAPRWGYRSIPPYRPYRYGPYYRWR